MAVSAPAVRGAGGGAVAQGGSGAGTAGTWLNDPPSSHSAPAVQGAGGRAAAGGGSGAGTSGTWLNGPASSQASFSAAGFGVFLFSGVAVPLGESIDKAFTGAPPEMVSEADQQKGLRQRLARAQRVWLRLGKH